MTLFIRPTFRSASRAPLGLAIIAACLAGSAITRPALAQSAASLPEINVDSTRLIGTGGKSAPSGNSAATGAPQSGDASAVNSIGIVGAATSVITADDIAHSPSQTIQEILATVPGVQLQSLYGSTNGARTTVDMRGFGQPASSNTLILINGRRLNANDSQGVDLSTIPLQSIERIEVTRGSSGAVLYGDNAIGGVINIVTKTSVDPKKPIAMRAEAGVGSYGDKRANVSVGANAGPWSTAFFGSQITSDGYRQNNALEQRSANGDLRYSTPDLTGFVSFSADDQHLGLPGGRNVSTTGNPNFLFTNRAGAATPFDYGDQQQRSITTGFTKSLWSGTELIVDGGVKTKDQQGVYTSQNANVDTQFVTWSITPRLSIKNSLFGMKSAILTGIDYYNDTYESSRHAPGAPPVNVFNIDQQSVAGYWQHTLGLLSSTDFSYGARLQHNDLQARDRLDPTAPNFFGQQQTSPLNTGEDNYAWHLGLEHRLNSTFTLFGRAARAFRTPNVDERIGSGPFGAVGNFKLKTQTSNDLEGGVRIQSGAFNLQTSYFDMRLKNELHFDPINFINTNFDPTHRYGSETSASLQATDTVRLRGSLAYTRAVFTEGQFAGKDVPLVSPVSGTAGVTWNVWQKYVVLDAQVRAWSGRRLDADEANLFPLIGADATMDFKVSGEIDRFFWSISVNNAFNRLYYDYGVVFTPTLFSAYPLPGRTVMFKAGATF